MRKQYVYVLPAAVLIVLTIVVSLIFYSTLNVWSYVLLAASFAASLSLAASLVRKLHSDASQETLSDQVQAEFLEQQSRLDQRELQLANRLAVYHEWMEFPQPIDLASAPSDTELSELAEKDRQLNEMLAKVAEKLFNDVLANKYAPDGRFSMKLLRDDAQQLAHEVAGIYQELSDQPLLNTNMEDVLRSSSRVCLQMLTLLDQLPGDVKKHNIENLYAYVRRAVGAYGVYRKAEPYWGYVNGVYYLGRLALGAHPVSMGAWWLAGQVSRRATKQITAKYVNRQVLALLNETIRVLGYEVANLYGAGFRYRDANWIYAAELTELLVALPVNHRCLSQSLQEIGALALRSEFDRVFLYRCIAEGVGARAEQYKAIHVLTPDERQAVAHRLERFANAFFGAASPKRLKAWQAEAEKRLDIRIQLNEQTDEENPQAAIDAVRSLMGFLVEIKQFEAEQAWNRVAETKSMQALDQSQMDSLRSEWDKSPAYFFELPDLQPNSATAGSFLEQLVQLAVTTAPRDPDDSDLLGNVAAFLRTDEKQLEKMLREQSNAAVASRLPNPPQQLEIQASLALLNFLDDVEQPLFVFAGIQPKWAESPPEEWTQSDDLLLLGDENHIRAIAVAEGSECQVIWRAARGEATADKGRYLSGEYSIDGGEWLHPSTAPERLVVRMGRFTMRRSTEYYRELLDWIASDCADDSDNDDSDNDNDHRDDDDRDDGDTDNDSATSEPTRSESAEVDD